LSIQTYRKQGVSKRGVTKSDHAIIYTGREAPQPKRKELPPRGKHGMRRSVRVVSQSKKDKLDSMSRVNFAKIYTVEHNVKVYDFGQVHSRHEHRLISQFNEVFRETNKESISATVAGSPDQTLYQSPPDAYSEDPLTEGVANMALAAQPSERGEVEVISEEDPDEEAEEHGQYHDNEYDDYDPGEASYAGQGKAARR